MSDTPDPKPGVGKALTAGGVTFVSVLISVLLRERYQDTFKEVEGAGYPLPFIIASVSGVLAHVLTWWTSADVPSILISWIKSFKRIQKAFNEPPT